MQGNFCEPCRAELIRGNICPHILPSHIIKNIVMHHLNFLIWNLSSEFCSLPLVSYRTLQIQFDTTETEEFQSTSSLRRSDTAQKGLKVPRNVDLPPPALLFCDTLHCNPRRVRSSNFLQHSNAGSSHFSSCKNHQGGRKRSTKQKHGWVCGFHLIKNRTGFNTVFICTQ